MARRTLFPLLFVLVTISLCIAQRPGGRPPQPSPGTSGAGGLSSQRGGIGGSRTVELVVHVVYPNDRPAGESISVAVEATTGGVIAQYFTNSEGQVRFSSIPAGSYIIRVRGANIKDTETEQLTFDQFGGFRNEYVHVQPLDEDASKMTSKEGSISAAELKIPGKARKEFDKGTEAYANGEYQKALEFFEKAVQSYPKYAMAYNNIGVVYMKTGDRPKAREFWGKALEADANLLTANCNVARLDLMESDFSSAIPFLDKALSVQPSSGEALLLMSEAQLMTGNLDKALTYARKVHVEEHQELAMARIVAGRALEQQNRPDLARAEYEALIREAPSSKEAAEAHSSITRLDQSAKKQ